MLVAKNIFLVIFVFSILKWYSVCLYLRAFVLITSILCVQAQAQVDKNKDTSPKFKYGVNTPLGDTYAAVKSVADEQTRFVLYRAVISQNKRAGQLGVISVYVNDRYHASLQKDAFSVICLSGKKTDVRTRYLSDYTAESRPEHDAHQVFSIEGGRSVYLRVAEDVDNKTRIEVVTPQVAASDLENAKQQMHISLNNCISDCLNGHFCKFNNSYELLKEGLKILKFIKYR